MECGLWPGGVSETYELSTQSKQGIIKKSKDGVSFFGVKQTDDCSDFLPYIYSTIKMHKNFALLFLQGSVPLKHLLG